VSSTDDYIKELVDRAPPLTPEQRDRLAALLRPDIQPQPAEVRKPATTVDDMVASAGTVGVGVDDESLHGQVTPVANTPSSHRPESAGLSRHGPPARDGCARQDSNLQHLDP
jgi:hypothetical protein